MADKKFDLEIMCPDRSFFHGEADMVEFNTTEGYIGVYPAHIPLATILSPGVLVIHNDGVEKRAAVHSGFAEILPEKVTLLAEVAEWPDEIDVERAEAAKKRAEERLASKAESVDVMRAELALRRALVRMDIAK